MGKRKLAFSPLVVAIFRSDIELIRQLIDGGADVNELGDMQRTPLIQAAIDNKINVVSLLLDHGAAVNAQDSLGYSSLHYAAQGSHLELARLLLSRGAVVDLADTKGATPLKIAVFNFHDSGEFISLLVEAGADPHHQDNRSQTPLTLAEIMDKANEILPFLMASDKSAKSNAKGEDPFSEINGDPVELEGNADVATISQIPIHESVDAVAKWVWKNLVPASGQSKYVQGELLRCIEKLRYEAQNNGNLNWDGGFVLIADFIEQTLCADKRLGIRDKRFVQQCIGRLKDQSAPYTENVIYDQLTAVFAKYCQRFPRPIDRPLNRNLKR